MAGTRILTLSWGLLQGWFGILALGGEGSRGLGVSSRGWGVEDEGLLVRLEDGSGKSKSCQT